MADEFDPYHVWFGIPKKQQPPTHYRLLGVDAFEENPRVIEEMAEQRLLSLKQKRTGPNAIVADQLMTEVTQAKLCLLTPSLREAYDTKLRSKSPPGHETNKFPDMFGAIGTPPTPNLLARTVSPGNAPKELPKRKRAVPDAKLEMIKIVAGGAAGIVIAICILWYGMGIDITGLFASEKQVETRETAQSQNSAPVEDLKRKVESSQLNNTPQQQPVISRALDQDNQWASRPDVDLEKPNTVENPAASRRLWGHETGYYIRDPDGKWRQEVYDGRRYEYQEVSRNNNHIDLLRSDGLTNRLSAGSVAWKETMDFQDSPLQGTWIPDIAALRKASPTLAAAEEVHRVATQKARNSLLAEIQEELLRLNSVLDSGSNRQEAESLKYDLASFERVGVVPWTEALRGASLAYIGDLQKARRLLGQAIDRELSKWESSDDVLVQTLKVFRFEKLRPLVVLNCQYVDAPSYKDIKNYTFYVDGEFVEGRLIGPSSAPLPGRKRWKSGKTGLVLLVYDSPSLIYRVDVAANGRTFQLTARGSPAQSNIAPIEGELTRAPDAHLPFRLDGDWRTTHHWGNWEGSRTIQGFRLIDHGNPKLCSILVHGNNLLMVWPTTGLELLELESSSPNLLSNHKTDRLNTWERME